MQAKVVAVAGVRFGQGAGSKAAASNADAVGQRRDKPEQGRAAAWAEVALLVVLAGLMVEGVHRRRPGLLHHGRAVKVGRNAKGTAGALLAVRAMAHAVQNGRGVDADACLPTGATGSGH